MINGKIRSVPLNILSSVYSYTKLLIAEARGISPRTGGQTMALVLRHKDFIIIFLFQYSLLLMICKQQMNISAYTSLKCLLGLLEKQCI